jgi:hypothetical protein
VQIVDHCVDKLRAAPMRIKVLVPQNQISSAFRSPLGNDAERARVADMQQTSR